MLVAGLTTATGRVVKIEGSVELRPGLAPGLLLEGVSIGPADDSAFRKARIGHLDIVVGLWPLLQAHVEVRRLELSDATLVVDPASAGDSAPASLASDLTLKRVDVSNLTVEIQQDGGRPPAVAHIQQLGLTRTEATSYSLELTSSLEGGTVTGEGTLDLAPDDRSLSATLHADIPHLQALSALAQTELPRVGPVKASAQLDVREDGISLSELDVQVGTHDTAWVELKGHVRDVVKRQDFALTANFGFDDVRVLAPLVRSPPHIGRIEGRANIHDSDGPTRIEEFTVEGGRPGVFELSAKGHFDDVESLHGLDATVDLKVKDLAVVGELLGRTLPRTSPVEVSGHVTAADGKLLTDHLDAKVGRTQLSGDVSGGLQSDERLLLKATVQVPELYLADLGFVGDPDPDDTQPGGPPPGTSAGSLFDNSDFDLSWIRDFDGDLTVHLGSVLGADSEALDDVRVYGHLERGHLSLRHVVADVRGGAVQGELNIDGSGTLPKFNAGVTATGLNLGEVLAELDVSGAWSGQLDGKLDFSTRGQSLRVLAANLDGELALTSGAGTISRAQAGLLTRDMLQSVRRVVGMDDPSDVLNCMVIEFEANDGVASAQTLVIDSKDIVVVGEGKINLRSETLDLRLVPKPRNASLFSTAATVQVKGPLTNPAVHIEPYSLVTSTTRAIVDKIGAVSGLKRLWRMITGDPGDQYCENLTDQTNKGSAQ